MRIYIITEGGAGIGLGHIVRCLSVCQAFEEKGFYPEFIIKGGKDTKELLKDKNCSVFDWHEDTPKLFSIVNEVDVVIVDSYLANLSVYDEISKRVSIPVYIDDYLRLDYPKGVILNSCLGAEGYKYSSKAGRSFLLGIKYALLRQPFWQTPPRKINEKVENVMLTFGGHDDKNMAPVVLGMLKDNYPGADKNVVIGKCFDNVAEIKSQADANTNFIYAPNAEQMKVAMLEADVAISAGGQTINELAATGTPTISVCVADNQKKHLRGWEGVGFLKNAGWHNDRQIVNAIRDHLSEFEFHTARKHSSEAGKKCVDGRGSRRVVEEILKLKRREV